MKSGHPLAHVPHQMRTQIIKCHACHQKVTSLHAPPTPNCTPPKKVPRLPSQKWRRCAHLPHETRTQNKQRHACHQKGDSDACTSHTKCEPNKNVFWLTGSRKRPLANGFVQTSFG
jgi:hypothetical protein